MSTQLYCPATRSHGSRSWKLCCFARLLRRARCLLGYFIIIALPLWFYASCPAVVRESFWEGMAAPEITPRSQGSSISSGQLSEFDRPAFPEKLYVAIRFHKPCGSFLMEKEMYLDGSLYEPSLGFLIALAKPKDPRYTDVSFQVHEDAESIGDTIVCSKFVSAKLRTFIISSPASFPTAGECRTHQRFSMNAKALCSKVL